MGIPVFLTWDLPQTTRLRRQQKESRGTSATEFSSIPKLLGSVRTGGLAENNRPSAENRSRSVGIKPSRSYLCRVRTQVPCSITLLCEYPNSFWL